DMQEAKKPDNLFATKTNADCKKTYVSENEEVQKCTRTNNLSAPGTSADYKNTTSGIENENIQDMSIIENIDGYDFDRDKEYIPDSSSSDTSDTPAVRPKRGRKRNCKRRKQIKKEHK
ncbi:hypothetical protein L9F63_007881, partial [Diploptera punctata]